MAEGKRQIGVTPPRNRGATSGAGRLCVIDGSSLIYRAYHAIPPLSTSTGLPTNATYGFTAMLLAIEEQKPSHLVVAQDAKKPTWRHELWSGYKATRPPMPADLLIQIQWIDRILEVLRIPAIRVPRYEADDVIATLVRRAREVGLMVEIVSGDKDLMSLVGEDVIMVDTMKDVRYGPAEVEEKLGVSGELVADFLALAGDRGDNIPGVPGIGPKTAAALLRKYGSLERILVDPGVVEEDRWRRKITAHLGEARLSHALVRLDDQVPLPDSGPDSGPDGWPDIWFDGLIRREPDYDRLREVLRELEFYRLAERLVPAATGAGKAGFDCRIVSTAAELEEIAAAVCARGAVAVDTETSNLNPLRADLVGISLCHEDDPGRPWYIPLAHDEQSEEQRESLRLAVDRILGPVLKDPGIEKCGHNIKYDLLVLERAGLPLAGIAFDSMVASYVLNPERHRHSLSAISQEVLGIVPETYTDVTGKGKQQKPFAAVPVTDAARYSGADALLAWRLQTELKRQLAEKPRLAELFATIEMPLVEVLARMEAAGVRIDVGHLERLRADYGRRLEALEAEIYAAAGVEFNINSSRQLGEVLFDRLNLPVLKKTKTGASTNVEVLTELAAQHPLPGMVLAWRSLTKLTSTYIEALPRLVHPETGRVHTSYNQTVTATGRLSSSDPNLQNIPIRGEDGSDIRRAFIARDGWKMLAADYSQIELRILAHLSGDAELTAAFARGDDIHTLTAARLFGVLPLMVTADMRREAKVVNFGVLYGMSAFGLAKELKIDRTQAKAYIDSYFATYTGVREYFDRIIAKGERRGYVETMFGRRRYLPDLTSRNPARREAARRAAVNSPIQGTAADIIKRAMITIDRRRREEGWRAVMIMQVHDELVFEVPPEELQPLRDLVRAEMGGAAALEIPLVVDIGVGDNWLEAH